MLHVIGLFFILGIGCDDLFVMCDAWVQAQWLAPPAVHQSTEARLWWSYKRAGKAMLVTTLTDVRTSHGSREQGAGSRRGGGGAEPRWLLARLSAPEHAVWVAQSI